jgi:organic hydroperoxide reductase OsmC/OhrA
LANHTSQIHWQRGDQRFTDNRYSRRHMAAFDGGAEVALSASPHVVPIPYSDPTAVDPEELYVASLSSCHMLWFLSIAAKAGFCVDEYKDAAEGVMEPNEAGQLVITNVTLRPACHFSGEAVPTAEQLDELHEKAHHACFLANSVRTQITIEPVK